MKQTALHQKHLHLKAKMTDFQGWQIPQVYTDVQDEHHAVRTAAGLFDVGFLGRIEISGPDAIPFLQRVFTRDVSAFAERTTHYAFLCNDSGTILDDNIVFRFSDGRSGPRFLLTPNAANTEKVLGWLKKLASAGVVISDATRSLAQLSLQGPQAPAVLEKYMGSRIKKFKPRAVREFSSPAGPIIAAQRGYTGEHGYELFIPSERSEQLWDSLIGAGASLGLMPCGYASRAILRLESGYLSYGNDIDETRSPFEAGLGRFVDLKKDFIGKDALLRLKEGGITQKLAGFLLLDKSVPRVGGSIFSENREIGIVTSGGLSPSLRKGIGLGYVISRYGQPGQEIEIEIRDREVVANIVELPFYKKK